MPSPRLNPVVLPFLDSANSQVGLEQLVANRQPEAELEGDSRQRGRVGDVPPLSLV